MDFDLDVATSALFQQVCHKERRIGLVIPTKVNQIPDAAFDRAAYRERNVVERRINRLKQHRRLATRYEKRAAYDLAMLTLAAIPLWL